jgi:hypothetical protein
MPTTLETPPPIAALSVQDAAITGERKSLHRYVTVRVLRWAQAEKHIVSRPVLRYMKVLAALGSWDRNSAMQRRLARSKTPPRPSTSR